MLVFCEFVFCLIKICSYSFVLTLQLLDIHYSMPAKSMSSSRQTTIKGYNLEINGNDFHLMPAEAIISSSKSKKNTKQRIL